MTPAQFRKKPVTISAVQWNGTYTHAKELEIALGLKTLGMTAYPFSDECTWWKISTLEDGHVVSPMDWIITGVKGEHYPCKPDIFELTYEPALASTSAQPTSVVAQEPVAWMFQHDETGMWNYLANNGMNNPTNFLKANPRYGNAIPLFERAAQQVAEPEAKLVAVNDRIEDLEIALANSVNE